MRSQGHTATEYAICIGLLAVLAISSLSMLGTNISALLMASANGEAHQQTTQLYALIGSNTGSGAGFQATPSSSLRVGDMALQLKINPSTGQVVTTDTTGGSKNTTSVPGDQAMLLMAQQLGQVASTPMPNGQPVPSEVQRLLQKLTQDGITLSENYADTLALGPQFEAINAANDGKTSGLQMYPSDMTAALGDSLANSLQFQQDYDALKTVLDKMAESDPSLQDSLIEPINRLAGGISTMQYQNVGKAFVDTINPKAIATSDMLDIYQSNPPIKNAVPTSEVMNTLLMPPDKAAETMQQLIANAAQNAVVGTPPTPNAPVAITVTPPPTPVATINQGATNAISRDTSSSRDASRNYNRKRYRRSRYN